MRNRLMKLGWSKKIKKRQIDSQNITSNIESSIDKLFLKRIERLKSVKRFVLGWLGLFLITIIILVIQFNNLNNYYLSTNFVKGGIYSEGLEGTFTNANPIYSIGDANSSVSKLIFAGLLTYDNRGKLIGDLAKNWEINNRGNEYTVHLKPNIFWQDGVPLTAKDIVFTFNTIENADAQSPLFANWQDVQVSAINKSTVSFKLPGELASFPNNLTTGIIPEHLLKNIPPQNLRSASFNTIHPIGAGPFSWGSINEKNTENSDQGILQISFNPFSKYVNGRPKLDQFFMNIYANQNKMYEDFKNKSLTAIAAVNTPPSSVFEGAGVIKHNLILRAANMVFFKTSTGVLSDQSVRQALGEATNQKDILNHLGYMTVPVKEPLLIGQLGYNPIYAQSPFNLSAAKQKLMSDGWTSFKKGVRQKNNQFLNFTLVAANTTENQTVTKILKSNWQKLGVNLTIQLQNQTDFQQSLTYHDYDAVLTSITIGSDPDVFVYWDSSQADIRSANRLNLSEYKNPIVDVAVESGRTRIDPSERIIKYQSLLSQWQQDTPAVGLFQPRLLYLTNGPVGAIDNQSLNTSIDRFDNVQDWAVKQAKVSPN